MELQQASPELSSYDRALYSIWQLSFHHVKQQCEVLGRLVRCLVEIGLIDYSELPDFLSYEVL